MFIYIFQMIYRYLVLESFWTRWGCERVSIVGVSGNTFKEIVKSQNTTANYLIFPEFEVFCYVN